MNSRITVFLCLFVIIFIASGAYAIWMADGSPVCVQPYDQVNPQSVSDGRGGAIHLWWYGERLYVQRIDSTGVLHWGLWRLYAQRVDSDGNLQWTVNGEMLCPDSYQNMTSACVDGAGGAFALWSDSRRGLYGQRIDAGGNLLWSTGGAPIVTVAAPYGETAIVPDAAGGAFAFWADSRTGSYELYAQRVTSNGTPRWNSDGVAAGPGSLGGRYPVAIADGEGGAITLSMPGLWAQKIDSTGTLLWGSGGVTVLDNAYFSWTGDYTLITDGAGGAVFTWNDARSGNEDIYAQSVAGNGVVRWTANGASVAAFTGDQQRPRLSRDDADGVYIAWADSRSGDYDIYAQKCDADTVELWTPGGVLVCGVAGTQAHVAVSPGFGGGAVIGWHDRRSGDYDIFTRWIGPDAEMFDEANPVITAVEDVPNDQGGQLLL
jgi:hypothetical protein